MNCRSEKRKEERKGGKEGGVVKVKIKRDGRHKTHFFYLKK